MKIADCEYGYYSVIIICWIPCINIQCCVLFK